MADAGPMNRHERAQLAAVSLGALLLYASTATRAVHTGDAAIYVFNATSGNLSNVAIHMGHYLLGAVFVRALAVIGIAPDTAMSIMAAGFGSAGVAAIYLLTRRLVPTSSAAVFAALSLGVAFNYWYYSTFPEMYAVQASLIFWAMYLTLGRRDWWAGIIYGLAILVSPLSLAALPAIVVLSRITGRRAPWLTLRFVIAAAAVTLPFLAALHHEYLWGRRGLLASGQALPWRPLATIVKEDSYELAKAFGVLMVPVCAGVVLVAIRNRQLLFVIAVLVAAHIPVLAKPGDAGAFLLPAYGFIGMISGVGLSRISAWRRPVGDVIAACLLIATFATSLSMLWPRKQEAESFKRLCPHIARVVGRNGVLIADWSDGVVYSYYAAPQRHRPPDRRPGWANAEEWALTAERMDALYRSGRPLYVLEERYRPVWLARVLLSPETIRQRTVAKSILRRAQRLGLPLSPNLKLTARDVSLFSLIREHGGEWAPETRTGASIRPEKEVAPRSERFSAE
ncbi:MAG: hypothetical protein JSV65_14275 [Armatimonadota bacterium]|nr:MAG: hypothetical protein JSV65_14275 [Armatimonadota bacterium]